MEIGKYERLTLSHLLKYFAGVPYCKKERRERGKGREKIEISNYERLALSHLLRYFAGLP